MSESREGSISHGTVRTADLIQAFHTKLAEFDEEKAQEIRGLTSQDALDALEVCIEKNDGWLTLIEDEHTIDEIEGYLDELHDALEECAPDGYYFGTHPGDLSDYGFWRHMEV